MAPDVSKTVEQFVSSTEDFRAWERTLLLHSKRSDTETFCRITAGGVAPDKSETLASNVVDRLRDSKDVHFLSLAADRAYPQKNNNINEIAEAYDISGSGSEYTRGRSFRSTATLHDEWLKYFLAWENQAGTKLMKDMRRASQSGATPPVFNDHFATFKDSLSKILPHVVFTGVDTTRRTLLFDTTGMELSFDQLSGGEREIVFLVGQIDRFGLREGLFLLDEPELHLNADLIRSWVAYLLSTVSTGQIWLATHSLASIEAAGQQAIFILERDDVTKKFCHISRLDSRPELSAQSRSVGTPAFSISQLIFVFAEGEESVGEQERFRKLSGSQHNVRFMECGSCKEVMRRDPYPRERSRSRNSNWWGR